MKAATWNHVSVRTMLAALRRLGEWTRKTPGHSFEANLGAAFRRLGLRPESLPLRTPEAILDWLPGGLSDPAKLVHGGIRLCPDCFAQGYHFPIFQIAAYSVCPEHGTELVPLSSIEGAGDFPSQWLEIPAPREGAWWPPGYRSPAKTAKVRSIERETLRILRAREVFGRESRHGTQLAIFPTWPAETSAASFFEGATGDDDAMHAEAFHLFVQLYASWEDLDAQPLGRFLQVGTKDTAIELPLWAHIAKSVSPRVEPAPRGAVEPFDDAEAEPLSAQIRRHAALRNIPSAIASVRQTFAREFLDEHGPCFQNRELGDINTGHIPCVHCRAFIYWEQVIRPTPHPPDRAYRWAEDQALGMIARHLNRLFPIEVVAPLTIECFRALWQVWSRALYFAILWRLRRPGMEASMPVLSREFEQMKRSLFARSLLPPAVLDLSKLPDRVRVHYLASVRDQQIPESTHELPESLPAATGT